MTFEFCRVFCLAFSLEHIFSFITQLSSSPYKLHIHRTVTDIWDGLLLQSAPASLVAPLRAVSTRHGLDDKAGFLHKEPSGNRKAARAH